MDVYDREDPVDPEKKVRQDNADQAKQEANPQAPPWIQAEKEDCSRYEKGYKVDEAEPARHGPGELSREQGLHVIGMEFGTAHHMSYLT
jgi:hypothetical protein